MCEIPILIRIAFPGVGAAGLCSWGREPYPNPAASKQHTHPPEWNGTNATVYVPSPSSSTRPLTLLRVSRCSKSITQLQQASDCLLLSWLVAPEC